MIEDAEIENYTVKKGNIKITIVMQSIQLIGQVKGYYSLTLGKQYLTLQSFLVDVKSFDGEMTNRLFNKTTKISYKYIKPKSWNIQSKEAKL